MNLIEINDLSFRYNNSEQGQNKPVLDGLSLTVPAGESVGIIGANGVGKSTLLKLLVGLLPSYEGDVLIDGLTLEKNNLAAIRQKLGYIFQDSDSQLFMNTVEEDVAFGPRNYGCSEEDVARRVQEALKKTHIENLSKRHIYRLSGGQKKLVAIAAILSMGTDILLMDEPSVALDPENRENLIDILRELPGTKLIASHDLDFIYDTCKRVVILKDGKAAVEGATGDILKNREILENNGLRLPLSFRFMGDKR